MQLHQKFDPIVNRPVVARYQNASHNPKSKKVSGIRRSKIWRNSGNANHFTYYLMKGNCSKGQLISKCHFGVFNFLQKNEQKKSTWGFVVVEFVLSFFGGNVSLKVSFWLFLTFSNVYKMRLHWFRLLNLTSKSV